MSFFYHSFIQLRKPAEVNQGNCYSNKVKKLTFSQGLQDRKCLRTYEKKTTFCIMNIIFEDEKKPVLATYSVNCSDSDNSFSVLVT